MTTFKYALSICGLSQQEAAEFFQVSFDSVKSWAQGKRQPPRGVWEQLASLYRQIENAADGASGAMELDGIDPRAYNNLDADIIGDELPTNGAKAAAGAMALLLTIADEMEDA